MLRKRKLAAFLRIFTNGFSMRKSRNYSTRRRIAATFALLVLLFLVYFIYKTSFLYLVFFVFRFKSYDLMSDALVQQNIDKIKLDCEHEQEERMLTRKFDLLKRYYNLRPFSSEFGWHDLYYRTKFDLSPLPTSFTIIIENLKLCSLDEFRLRFAASQVNNSTIAEMILRRKELSPAELRLVGSERILEQGGLFQTPFCLQELLHEYSNWTTLETVYKMVKNYDPKSNITRKDLLISIGKFTFPILESLILENSRPASELYARKASLTVVLVPYLNRKQNLVDFLFNMHSFLQRQFITYMIVIAEQYNSNEPFNKGKLYNAAFRLEKTIFNPYLILNFNYFY